MPPSRLLLGGVDFTDWFITLKHDQLLMLPLPLLPLHQRHEFTAEEAKSQRQEPTEKDCPHSLHFSEGDTLPASPAELNE